MNSSCMNYETMNLGAENNPQNIKLGTQCKLVEREDFIKVVKEYKDEFSQTHNYLKTFDTKIMKHNILVNHDINPYQRKLRKMDPNVEPSIKKELNKLLSARIIFPAKNTQWIENLVPVRKINGDIHLCVDFRYLNRASKKYKYPVPPMEQILQKVFCSDMFSLLDGFSSYNKVLVSHSYQFKTSIKTPWGTF